MQFRSVHKNDSPTIHGLSHRAQAAIDSDLIPFDRLAIKHGVTVSKVYAKSGGNWEWHHVAKIVKGKRTGPIVICDFGTEDDFIEFVLDGYYGNRFKMTPEITIEMLAHSVDRLWN